MLIVQHSSLTRSDCRHLSRGRGTNLRINHVVRNLVFLCLASDYMEPGLNLDRPIASLGPGVVWLRLMGSNTLEGMQEGSVWVFGGTDAALFNYHWAAMRLQGEEGCNKNHERS